MSGPTPNVPSSPRDAAERSIARAVGVARVSSWVMLVLGVASLLVSLRAPLSAGCAISIAVCLNGWIERGGARRLARHDHEAPKRLALNQVALGLEVIVYAAWQAHAIGPEQIDAVLRRPMIARFLAALDAGALQQITDLLPAGVRAVYVIVGAGTFLGCCGTAAYYLSRVRALRVVAATAGGTVRPPRPSSESPR